MVVLQTRDVQILEFWFLIHAFASATAASKLRHWASVAARKTTQPTCINYTTYTTICPQCHMDASDLQNLWY